MIVFKNLFPTSKDIKITWHSIIQAGMSLPFVAKKIIFYVIGLILFEILYFYFVFSPMLDLGNLAVSQNYLSLISAAFVFLELLFLYFLVPFFIYNKGSRVSVRPFLARTVWPVTIDTVKALFILCGYLIISLIVLAVINFFHPILFSIQEWEWSVSSVMSGIVTALCLLPVGIRMLQLQFIPFVVFFHKEYLKRVSSIKLSTKIARGLPVVLLILFGAAYPIYSVVESGGIHLVLSSQSKVTAALYFGLFAWLRMLFSVFFVSIQHFIYIAKEAASYGESQ